MKERFDPLYPPSPDKAEALSRKAELDREEKEEMVFNRITQKNIIIIRYNLTEKEKVHSQKLVERYCPNEANLFKWFLRGDVLHAESFGMLTDALNASPEVQKYLLSHINSSDSVPEAWTQQPGARRVAKAPSLEDLDHTTKGRGKARLGYDLFINDERLE